MEKRNDLWDDSALIDAFDNAMATYKVMHKGDYRDDTRKEEKHTDDNDETDQVLTEKITEIAKSKDNSTYDSTKTAEPFLSSEHIGAALNALPTQKNITTTEGYTAESYQHHSGYHTMAEPNNSYFNESNEQYSQLLKQYYELEEQQQTVLQQLHQSGYWNYQTPVQSSSDHVSQVPAQNISGNSLYPQCSQCCCQCLASSIAPDSSAISGLSFGGHCCCSVPIACCSPSFLPHFPVYPMKLSTFGDDSAAKTGMLVAERAICSMNMNRPPNSSTSDDKDKGKEEESSGATGGKELESKSSGSNLSVVLNAWYAAGFHTGRYLMEQTNKRNSCL